MKMAKNKNKKPDQKPEKKPKVKRDLSKFKPLAIIAVNVALVLVNIMILVFLPKTNDDIVILRSEILAQKLQLQNAQKLFVDINGTSDEQQKIYNSLPNKARLLEVIEFLETLGEVVANKSFNFEREIPIKDKDGFLYLPLSLTVQGSLSQTMTALQILEKAPYLLVVNQSLIESPEGVSGNISVQVGLKLYVSEPFVQN